MVEVEVGGSAAASIRRSMESGGVSQLVSLKELFGMRGRGTIHLSKKRK